MQELFVWNTILRVEHSLWDDSVQKIGHAKKKKWLDWN